MVRVPLPVKVLLAFLLVLGVGAVPVWLYLDEVLHDVLVERQGEDLKQRLTRLAKHLEDVDDKSAVALLRGAATLTPDRITLTRLDGRTLFDSQVNDWASKQGWGQRPELKQAIAMYDAELSTTTSGKSRTQQKKTLPMGAWPVATAVRTSTELNVVSHYAAVRLPAPHQTVLRLSRPLSEVDAITQGSVRFWRNTQAAAISVALLLSLVAAMVLVRPLRRLQRSVGQVTDGDFTADVALSTQDEIGDLSRDFAKLATQLRRRAALQGTGEALLSQLVEVLPGAVAIYEPDGDVVTLNGAARRWLHIEGPSAGERIRRLRDHPAVKGAAHRAEQEGAPEPVEVTLKGGIDVEGWVYVLRRPGHDALHVLFSQDAFDDVDRAPLPHHDDVRPRTLSALMSDAQEHLAGLQLQAGRMPDVLVADAGDGLLRAVQQTLATYADDEADQPLALHVEVNDTQVGLAFDASLHDDVIAELRPLLEPVGGALDAAPGEVTLWLPRA